MRDFKRLQNDPPQGVNGSPKSDSIMLWNAVIFGPDDTPWDGGMSPVTCQSFLTGCLCQSDHMHILTHCNRQRVCHAQVFARSAGTFKLTLEFSEEYPNKAPVVKFKSTMFHPNSKY